jgi:hypothetical protein
MCTLSTFFKCGDGLCSSGSGAETLPFAFALPTEKLPLMLTLPLPLPLPKSAWLPLPFSESTVLMRIGDGAYSQPFCRFSMPKEISATARSSPSMSQSCQDEDIFAEQAEQCELLPDAGCRFKPQDGYGKICKCIDI